MKNLQFYRVQYSNGLSPFLVNTQTTVSSLYKQIMQKIQTDNFIIYYHHKPLPQSEHGAKKLKQIVSQQPMKFPVFIIFQLVNDPVACPIVEKYGQGVAQLQKSTEPEKQYSIGENGVIIFDNRHTSLLASSINQAITSEQSNPKKNPLLSSLPLGSQSPNSTSEQTLIKRVLIKLGVVKKSPTPSNLLSTITSIKQIKTADDLHSHIDRHYSDYDPKFAAYLQSIYLKYALLSGYRLHYIEYKKMEQGVIKAKIGPRDRVAIIGDFGTGLDDSFGLLRYMIIEKEVDIILHLGDVYYAGTPNQYKQHILKPLNRLRLQAAQRFKKNVYFYSIPGNHDYYSWGMPFLGFVADVNQVKQITGKLVKKKSQSLVDNEEQEGNQYKQHASYFCLQTQDEKWQFIGLDTAYHDSNPMNQINGLSLGPRLRQRQVQWFVDKMEHFPGSTILLTHHQLFSIHDRICGSLSQYKAFTCLNPLLSAQLFKYLPVISCWYWGHEHALMFFADDVMGVRKCRLLGNSSFHVFEKQGPYTRKKGFPYIPLIQPDQPYSHKYIPLNPDPNPKNPDCYYNLTYALIDFSKQKTSQFSPDPFSSTLQAQYYCCPCYPQQQAKKKHFQPYLLNMQEIQPRINANIITSEKLLKNQHEVVGNIHEITEKMHVFLKTQIGLFAEKGTWLSLAGRKYQIVIQNSCNIELSEKVGLNYQHQKQQQSEQVHHKLRHEVSAPNLLSKQQQQQQQQKPTFRRLLLDGDIISFKQPETPALLHAFNQNSCKQMTIQHSKSEFMSIKSKQFLEPPSPTPATGLKNPPKLQPIFSIESSTDSLTVPTAELLDKAVCEYTSIKFFQGKKFEIKKSRILKDVSLHIKFGDAFTLREINNDMYLSCQIGVYGGVLKLVHLKDKEKQPPCLFMFVEDSKVRIN